MYELIDLKVLQMLRKANSLSNEEINAFDDYVSQLLLGQGD
ncbi:MAG: hypothetical protein SOY88_00205 [Massilioclostridium sp.]|nr:hypothetical protein [Massilioclostridium sp.]